MSRLVEEKTPIFYINAMEKYFPVSINFYMKYSTLKGPRGEIITRDPVIEDLGTSGSYLSPSSDALHGLYDLKKAPIYRRVTDKVIPVIVYFIVYHNSNG